MNVLVACECSQEVCFAFRAAGHNSFSCDLEPSYGGFPEWHIRGDVSSLLNGGCTFVTDDSVVHFQSGPWDLVIAHPPCTYLSSVGASRLFNADHSIKDLSRELHGWEAREFFMKIFNCNALSLCIENPAPLSYFRLPPYSQIVQPYFFGDPYKKRTCLWLRNLPPLLHTSVVEPLGCWVVSSGGKSCRVKTNLLPSVHSSRLRSKTFPGLATAMASQWSTLFDLDGHSELRDDLRDLDGRDELRDDLRDLDGCDELRDDLRDLVVCDDFSFEDFLRVEADCLQADWEAQLRESEPFFDPWGSCDWSDYHG